MDEHTGMTEGQSSNKIVRVNRIPLMSWQTLGIINYKGNVIVVKARPTREGYFVGQVIWRVRNVGIVLVKTKGDYTSSEEAIKEVWKIIKIIQGLKLKKRSRL